MRLNFFLMVSFVVLICHNSQATAVGASNLKSSCAQKLIVSIGEKSILENGVLDEIASSYADAIWTSIVEIRRTFSVEEGDSDGKQMYAVFKDKVTSEINWVVYHEFVANLRSKHFLLGKFDRASKSIQELGLPQWGTDLVLGLAVATPVLAVIGASWIFFDQGDLRFAFGLPPVATGIGVVFASGYRRAEDRIHSQSRVLSYRFRDLVTAKLGERLLSVFPKRLEEDQLRTNIALWSKNRETQKIMDTIFWWHFIKGMNQEADVKAIGVDSN
ncbi:MAG: hypothetical protein IPL83_00525 [Bdellovibrionales bacterium]|nr:hypothetical protein [Bdellovibrionales bacterium]